MYRPHTFVAASAPPQILNSSYTSRCYEVTSIHCSVSTHSTRKLSPSSPSILTDGNNPLFSAGGKSISSLRFAPSKLHRYNTFQPNKKSIVNSHRTGYVYAQSKIVSRTKLHAILLRRCIRTSPRVDEAVTMQQSPQSRVSVRRSHGRSAMMTLAPTVHRFTHGVMDSQGRWWWTCVGRARVHPIATHSLPR